MVGAGSFVDPVWMSLCVGMVFVASKCEDCVVGKKRLLHAYQYSTAIALTVIPCDDIVFD